MERLCPCGKQIRANWRLCSECVEIYGIDSQEWPEWLRWMVSDIQREIDYERNRNYVGLEETLKPVFTLRGCRETTHLHEELTN